jgi:hypothetical protein
MVSLARNAAMRPGTCWGQTTGLLLSQFWSNIGGAVGCISECSGKDGPRAHTRVVAKRPGWFIPGFHLVLAIQNFGMTFEKNKGNTLLIFDNERRQELRFTDVICRPPKWSDEYYNRTKKQDALDQIIDVPYFGDSEEVSLIQVADFLAFSYGAMPR